MKGITHNAIVVSLCSFTMISGDAAFGAQSDRPITGNWMSKAGAFKIVFRVSQDKDGSLTALTDIPDQEAWDIPADVTVSGEAAVRFEIYNIRCVYEGTMSMDGKTIDGEFKGPDGGHMSFVLERVDNPPVRTSKRPQEPRRPYPYREEEVFFENRIDKVRLAGTLTLPRSDGPYPAALLVSGTGPNDRDQLIWGHRVFLVLADHLTRQGIAVLRYDDRGVGRSTGDYDTATFEEFRKDALAGLDYLRARPDIDPQCIGLIGHSEGGAVAILAAASSRETGYLVLMAAPGPSEGFEGLLKQFADSYRANGANEEAISVKCSILNKMFFAIRQEADLNVAKSRIRLILKKADPQLDRLSEDQRRGIEMESLDPGQFDWMLSPEFSSILRYDPKEALMKITCPVLAMNGGKDVQMPVENLRAIEAALEAGGNHRHTIREMPGLNHLFQTAQTGSPAEYSQIQETLSPAALNIISDWVRSGDSTLSSKPR
jgi:pimeloyl-ACP methyl ester carboxylesterase